MKIVIKVNSASRFVGLRVVAIGGRVFVNSLRFSGAGGIVVESVEEAVRVLNKVIQEPEVGLVLVSDEFGEEFSRRLNELRSKLSMPILYELPAPGSKAQRVDYRAVLRQVLGI